jgi:integrase
MPRRLSGSIRELNGTFEASVPERRGSKQRVYEYFDTRDDAERWSAAAVDALYADRPVPIGAAYKRPVRHAVDASAGDPTARHFFAQSAEAWHTERYIRLRVAGADRAQKVSDILRLHVLPFFTTMTARPEDFTRELVIEFLERMTGSRDATYPISEIATIADVPERRIRSLIDTGALTVRSVDKTKDRRPLIRLGDLEDALGVPRLRAAYARTTVKSIFETVKQVEAYMVALGILERAVTTKLPIPRIDDAALRRPPRTKPPCVPLADVAVIARRLHIVYQLALWLLRVCGLRIGEAYGIRVGDILDFGHGDRPGLIAIERQAGKAFLTYDEFGNTVVAAEKDELKTDGSVRALMVPAALMELIRLVIDVFHTDPLTGKVDLDSRLIPGIQEAGDGKQGSFQTALRGEVDAAVAGGDLDALFRPHDMRASLITDLAFSEVKELLRRLYAGHLPGTDVHSGYIRDSRNQEKFLDVAMEMQNQILASVGTLIQPTAKFPAFGRTHPLRERRDEIRSRLIEAGSLLDILDDDDEPLLDATDVALELGFSVSHARRFMREVLGADDSTGVCRVAHSALEAYQATKRPNLTEMAERTGQDYHQLHRLIGQLGLAVDRDPVTGDYAITDDVEQTLLAEIARLDALHARACNVHGAHQRLRKSHSTVRKLIRLGQLSIDPETDASGARFITFESIERYLTSNGGER